LTGERSGKYWKKRKNRTFHKNLKTGETSYYLVAGSMKSAMKKSRIVKVNMSSKI